MTDRVDSLKALREKVRAGQHVSRKEWNSLFHKMTTLDALQDAQCGSLDAAKALHDAVLHERVFVEVHYSKRYEDECRVSLNCGEHGWTSASNNPARAWLIAILSALTAIEEGKA